MTKKLHLASNLALPLDLATQAVAVLGIRGSGKTNTAGVIAEECLKASIPVAIIDPVDAWFGIRASADGTKDGWPVLIFGGTHGDLPLAESDGKTIAEFIAKEQVPCILSLRHLRKAAQRRFVADVFEDLYHLKGKPEHRTPLCVIIDEAPLFVPQQVQGDVARTVGAVEDLVNRGRISGFGVVMISQRAATINKNVLTQADTIIAHRLTSPQDRKALRDWIEENATVDELAEVLESLATLKAGEAWVWGPALDVMQRTMIRKRETFDSSRTPKIGERVQAPRRLAEIDLEAYRDRLGKAITEARENDPKELKRKLAELTKQLQQQKPAVPEKVVERVEVPVLKNGQLEAAHGLVDRMREMGEELLGKARDLSAAIGFRVTQQEERTSAETAPNIPKHIPAAKPQSRAATRPAASGPGEAIPEGERRILTAAAQYADGASRETISVLTGYKRSSRDTYLQRLRTRGFIDQSGERVIATDAGIAALGSSFEALPTGDALRSYWLARLPEGERRILEVLIGRYPDSVDRDELDEPTGYKRSSRDTYLQRLTSRRLVEAAGRGSVRASADLFD